MGKKRQQLVYKARTTQTQISHYSFTFEMKHKRDVGYTQSLILQQEKKVLQRSHESA